MAFYFEHPLDFRMTDPDCRCGVRGYIELFELGATEAVHGYDMGNDVLPYKFGIGWIFARYKLRVLEKAGVEAPLEETTWISSKPHRRFINREFEIVQSGRPVCLGRLECCFFDLKRQKITTPDAVNFPDELYEPERGVTDIGPYLRLDRDPSGAVSVFSHEVRFSDLDNNGHMNNLHYGNLVMSAFTRQELDEHYVRDLEIHFLSQCREFEKLEIRRRDVVEEGRLVASDVYLVNPEGVVACRARAGF